MLILTSDFVFFYCLTIVFLNEIIDYLYVTHVLDQYHRGVSLTVRKCLCFLIVNVHSLRNGKKNFT